MQANLQIIHIGKHNSDWYTLGDMYAKRVAKEWKLQIVAMKDAPSSLPIEERKKIETLNVLPALSTNTVLPIELHPEGKQYSSLHFAEKLQHWCENRTKIPTFIIAGTFGFVRTLLPHNRIVLSLSSMTFTHEMTFTLLLEQLYRAYTLIHRIPYHY